MNSLKVSYMKVMKNRKGSVQTRKGRKMSKRTSSIIVRGQNVCSKKITFMTFYYVWLKHKSFVYNITSKCIINTSDTELSEYLSLFYLNT